MLGRDGHGTGDHGEHRQSAEATWVGTGFALIAVGAVLACTFTGEVLGLDVDVVGWFLMTVGGVIVVAAAAIRRLRRSD